MVEMQTNGMLKVSVHGVYDNGAVDSRVWHMTRLSPPPVATDICRIGLDNSGPGKTWVWSDGSPTDFQPWMENEGSVAANNNRRATATIGRDDRPDRPGTDWNDQPYDHPSLSFLCERYE